MLNHMRFVSNLNSFKVLSFFLILSDLVGQTQNTESRNRRTNLSGISQIKVIKFCDMPGCQAVLH